MSEDIENIIQILTDKYLILNFNKYERTELDLGCGTGIFSLEIAQRNPNSQIIAADIMIGRLRKIEKKAKRLELKNLDILRVEATNLMSYMLKDNSIDRLHILCPDPWPKTKHKGHRLLSSQFMNSIKRVLKPNGVFHFSTDDKNYYKSTCKIVEESGIFKSSDKELISDVIDIKTAFAKKWESEGLEVRHIAWQVK
jgi:tRNA (guanine-N7-)-methyltransferase